MSVLQNKNSQEVTDRMRIGIQNGEGTGSISAYVAWFSNAILQRRLIAFDGQKWFVQGQIHGWFNPVSESEVPQEVKDRFSAKIAARLAALSAK